MQPIKNKMAYIIGDSAIRSFAYNNYFTPIMISAGAFNSHLTLESSKGVAERYKAFCEEYDLGGDTVYFFTNGDTIHHVRDTFNTLKIGEGVLYEAASRYVKMVLMLKEKFNVDAILLSSIPLEGELGMDTALKYNDHLKALAKVNDLKYVDIWAYVTREVNGKTEIKPDFLADDAFHLNHRFVYDFLKGLDVIEEGKQYWDIEYERYYNYEMPIKKLNDQKAKIWGDCHKDKLILDRKMAYQFNLFHQKTNEHEVLLKFLQPQFKNLFKCDSVTVDGCKDGYIAFSLEKMNIFKDINAQDSGENFISQANILKKLFKLTKTTFVSESDTKVKYNEIVLSLTKNLLTKKNKMKYFKLLNREGVKVLLYYSTDFTGDSKILRKSGFSKIYDLKINFENSNHYLLCLSSSFDLWSSLKFSSFIFHERVKAKLYVVLKMLYSFKKNIW